MMRHNVHRATVAEVEKAFDLVREYYEEVGVVAREEREEFENQYFCVGAGVWLAEVGGTLAGCIALRKLESRPECGEIKRMYVRALHRGRGIAESLLRALEEYALANGYEWLYLDTTDSMIAAARFYERSGYERCEKYNENPQASIFMRKQIGKV